MGDKDITKKFDKDEDFENINTHEVQLTLLKEILEQLKIIAGK